LRIGLLGGSFNPAHDGHLHLSLVALKRLGLDEVWWLVAPQNPLKSEQGMAPFDTRFASARAIAHHPRLRVLDIERALGTRYTIDTIAALQRRFPRLHFVWLMGSDNLDGFAHWRRWPALAERLPIAVITRPGSVLAPLRAKAAQRFARFRIAPTQDFATAPLPAFTVLDGPRNPASATRIREREP
jgi:nicotinate-nucleotide adenylyltransferase